jgi:hypothetical protein
MNTPTLSKEAEKLFDSMMDYSFIQAVIRDCEKSDKDLLVEIKKNIKPFLAQIEQSAIQAERKKSFTVERVKTLQVQQVAYSTYHDALTQVCFTCKVIVTNMEAITGNKE